jgi:hypothetical protein
MTREILLKIGLGSNGGDYNSHDSSVMAAREPKAWGCELFVIRIERYLLPLFPTVSLKRRGGLSPRQPGIESQRRLC